MVVVRKEAVPCECLSSFCFVAYGSCNNTKKGSNTRKIPKKAQHSTHCTRAKSAAPAIVGNVKANRCTNKHCSSLSEPKGRTPPTEVCRGQRKKSLSVSFLEREGLLSHLLM